MHDYVAFYKTVTGIMKCLRESLHLSYQILILQKDKKMTCDDGFILISHNFVKYG